jgi:hypothetical protein
VDDSDADAEGPVATVLTPEKEDNTDDDDEERKKYEF